VTKGTFRAYGPPIKFREETLRLIAQASSICAEYEAKGRPLTLRGLYYQHVARGLIENTDRSYNRLKGVVTDGRMAGLISWTAIEDLGRQLMGHTTWESPGEALDEAKRRYRRNKWADQETYPEVWVEKQALEGVIGTICSELEVDYYSCKGYNSMTEQWNAGMRFAQRVRDGQRPVVFHLGDHDPSGLHMTVDNRERLSVFAGVPIMVVRLALNRDQIDQYNPPPNPGKETDSRFATYAAEHGDMSWELDALDPPTIHDIIRDAIDRIRDEDAWEKSLARENAERQEIADAIEAAGLGPSE
jgi:hypothetical protein